MNILKKISLFTKKKQGKKKFKKDLKVGIAGEKDTISQLKKMGLGKCIVHDSIIRNPKTGKMCQIDLMVITTSALYIVEVKTQNFHTAIGSVDSDEWTLVYGNNSRFKSNNIFKQIFRQYDAAHELLRANRLPFPIHKILFIKNNNRVRMQISGIESSGVTVVSNLSGFSKIKDKSANKKVIDVFNKENEKNKYVRKYKN